MENTILNCVCVCVAMCLSLVSMSVKKKEKRVWTFVLSVILYFFFPCLTLSLENVCFWEQGFPKQSPGKRDGLAEL